MTAQLLSNHLPLANNVRDDRALPPARQVRVEASDSKRTVELSCE